MSVKLFRVILPVSDIESAASFYEQVLGMPGERVSAGRHYFDCDGTILACFEPKADGEGYDAKPNPEHLYFAVDDLEATYRAVEAAGSKLSQVTDPDLGPEGRIARRPWGEVSFYTEDPFGNRLCFVERSTMFTGNE